MDPIQAFAQVFRAVRLPVSSIHQPHVPSILYIPPSDVQPALLVQRAPGPCGRMRHIKSVYRIVSVTQILYFMGGRAQPTARPGRQVRGISQEKPRWATRVFSAETHMNHSLENARNGGVWGSLSRCRNLARAAQRSRGVPRAKLRFNSLLNV